jgi:hypothetical protein
MVKRRHVLSSTSFSLFAVWLGLEFMSPPADATAPTPSPGSDSVHDIACAALVVALADSLRERHVRRLRACRPPTKLSRS